MSGKLNDERREQAALLVAEGTHTTPAIARAVGVTTRTIERWRQNSSFMRRVGDIVADFSANVVANGIAERQARVDALNERWERMQRVIEERGTSTQMQGVAGGTTGLLTYTWKKLGTGEDAEIVPEYAVDTGLLRELRAHEQQAAQELGQWAEKREVTTTGDVRFTINFDRADSPD